MLRRIIAGTAVAGALTMGVAGVAGAATPGAGTDTATPSATVCAKAAKVEAGIQKWGAKVNTRLPKAEAREAKAKTAGHTKAADRIAKRIANVQSRESKLHGRLAKIEAKCGTTGSTGSGNTGTTAS
jgi:hypothetical protein